MAFKVKTTAPKLYCVRPNCAVVGPGVKQKVSVIFLGLSEDKVADTNVQDGEFVCKDKFLVMAVPAVDYAEGEHIAPEVWNELEKQYKSELQSKKIKVVYQDKKQDDQQQITQDEHSVSEAPAFQTKTEPVIQKTVLDTPVEDDRAKETPKDNTATATAAAVDNNNNNNKPVKLDLEPPLVAATTMNQHVSGKTLVLCTIVALLLSWLYY